MLQYTIIDYKLSIREIYSSYTSSKISTRFSSYIARTQLIHTIIAMTNDNTQFKKIIFHDFKSDEYKIWEITTLATLKLHKILEIIDESDSNSISHNSNNTIYVISPTMRARIIKWINDHEYTREAIIHCLSDVEFLKLKDVEESASEI